MFSIPKVMPFCNAVTTAPGSETGRCDLCLLMILHGCLFWVLAGVNLPLAHDTMINFQIFSTVYAGYLIDGQFPLWLPYSVHGISADYGYAFTFTPAFYAATFIGKLLSVSDSLQMFRLGLYFEEALLVWGLYRLSTLFHRHRATPAILAFTAILSVSWGTQIHWNFQLIYLLPFLLYHLTRWLRGNGLEYAAYASILLTLGGVFYSQIFVAATLFAFALLHIVATRPKPEILLRFGINEWTGVAIVCSTFVVALLNIQFARHVIDGMQSFTNLRNIDGTVSLKIFLSYGGYLTPEKLMELLYGAPVRFAFIAYSGLFTLLFIAYAVIKARSAALWIFLILAGLVLLFSLGKSGGIAEIAYYVFPAMDKFRHIGFVTPVAKILFIFASGFGMDHYLEKGQHSTSLAIILAAIAIILGAAIISIDMLNDWRYAYSVDNNLVVPFGFHYFQFSIVAVFILLCFLLRSNTTTCLIICSLLEIGSYRFVIEANSPAMTKPWSDRWQQLRHTYDVRRLPYSSMRQRESAPEIVTRLPMMDVWGVHHSFGYTASRLDLCLPIHRVDLSGTSFDALIRTRLAIPLAQTPQNYFTISTLEKDATLMDAIGCQHPKLYFAASPILTDSEIDENRFVRSSRALYERPIIRLPCGADCEVESEQHVKQPGNSIAIRNFTANHLDADVEVASEKASYLIYIDDLHPGWQAAVDGNPVTIYPANIAFKAIEIPHGRHQITFRFTGGSAWSAVTIWTNYILTTLISLGFLLIQILKVFSSVRTRTTREVNAMNPPPPTPKSSKHGIES